MEVDRQIEVKRDAEGPKLTTEEAGIDLMSMDIAIQEVANCKEVKNAAGQSRRMTRPNKSASTPKRMKTLFGKINKDYRTKRLLKRQKLYRTIPLMELRSLATLTEIPSVDVWPDSDFSDSNDSRFSHYISDNSSDFTDFTESTVSNQY